MDTRSQHLLAEYFDCDSTILNDLDALKEHLEAATMAAGATPVTTTFHRFSPQGVSGVVLIEESHLSIHTRPEAGYAAVDFYTCGDCQPQRAHELLLQRLNAGRSETMTLERGCPPGDSSIQIRAHAHDEHGPTK